MMAIEKKKKKNNKETLTSVGFLYSIKGKG